MECSKLSGKFLKVKAKVSGFLIARIEKRNTPEIGKYVPVLIKSKKNTITGLQYLINAFLTYMSGIAYTGATALSPGITITTSSGQTFTLSFSQSPGISLAGNTVIIAFTVRDDSSNSYTATSEQLITQSAGYNIPIATANLPVTKQSNEILILTWIITITIAVSGEINYVSTLTPQTGGWGCSSNVGSCSACVESSANSQYSTELSGCNPLGFTSTYSQTSFITSSLFIDMFYNNYKVGPSNPFVSYINGILYIYTLYCMEYFVAGINSGAGDFATFQNGDSCFVGAGTGVQPIYLQVYMPLSTQGTTLAYMGVQIEFTT
jgi:hypothetical protein